MAAPELLRRPGARRLALAATIAVLGVLLWQSDEPRSPEVRGREAAELRGPQEPDGFVDNGRYIAFDEQGQRISVIASTRIEQFDGRGEAVMQLPRATLYDRDDGTPWRITANTGILQRTRERLRLDGDVVITRPLPSGTSTLETEWLTIDNSQRKVQTDAPVLLTAPGMTTRATGMTAWIDERVLELESQVEGRYEPGNQSIE